jgi:hypothetical protein
MVKPKKKATKKRCDCISEINAQLDPQGLELDDRLVMNFGDGSASGHVEAPLVQLRRKGGKRGKVPFMFCAYCPFCGIKKV